MRLVVRRDILDGCKLFNPKKDQEKPKYGMIPHYYTCPVLKKERMDWVINQKMNGSDFYAEPNNHHGPLDP